MISPDLESKAHPFVQSSNPGCLLLGARMKHFKFIALLAASLAGCATTTPGNLALSTSANSSHRERASSYPLHGEEVVDFASLYMGLVNITISNHTENWLRIKAVHIRFENPAVDQQVKVPLGSDLYYWGKAMKVKLDVQALNRQIALDVFGGVAALAAGVGAVTENPGLLAVGGGAAVGSLAVSAIDGLYDQIGRVEMAQLVPPDHLLTPFAVPPGLFVKKWIVLYTPSMSTPCVSRMFIVLVADDDEEHEYLLPFRSTPSTWQPHCSHLAGQPSPAVAGGY